MTIKNVLIAGGSGNVGSILVNEFLNSNKYNVFVLSRVDSSATFPANVQVLKTDYSPASLSSVLSSLPESSRIDAIISNLNGPALGEGQIALIDAAKAAGVKRFFPSEFGLDTNNDKVLEWIGALKGKRQIVNYLKSKEGDGFSWTALVSGLFFDWGFKNGFQQVNFKENKFYHWDSGAVPYSVTNIATIGKALVNLLSTPDRLAATANKYVYVSSYTLTQNQLFDAVRRATPGEEWAVEHVDSKAVATKAKDEFANGNVYAAYDLIRVVSFGEGLGNLDDLSKIVSNDLLGLEKEDLDANVKKLLAEVKTQQ